MIAPPIKDLPRSLNLLLEPLSPENSGFSPDEGIALANFYLLKVVKAWQEGKAGFAKALIKEVEKCEEAKRKFIPRDPKYPPALGPIPKGWKPWDKLMTEFPQDLLLSESFEPNTHTWNYLTMWIRSFRFLSTIPGGIPWEKIKNCNKCEKFFLKNRRQMYCSETCRDAQWQKPYAKRAEYFKVLRKFEALLDGKKTKQEAIAYLKKTSPFKEIIQRKNLHPENWLKGEGG